MLLDVLLVLGAVVAIGYITYRFFPKLSGAINAVSHFSSEDRAQTSERIGSLGVHDDPIVELEVMEQDSRRSSDSAKP